MGQRADIMTDALAWAGTFHGIGARLLRDYADQIGLDPVARFTIARLRRPDEPGPAQPRLLKDREPVSTKGTCLAIYSRAVNSEAPLDDVLQSNFPWCAVWEKQLRELFAAYVENKQRHDFSITTISCFTGHRRSASLAQSMCAMCPEIERAVAAFARSSNAHLASRLNRIAAEAVRPRRRSLVARPHFTRSQ